MHAYKTMTISLVGEAGDIPAHAVDHPTNGLYIQSRNLNRIAIGTLETSTYFFHLLPQKLP